MSDTNEFGSKRVDAPKPGFIVAPTVGQQRCGTCKYQTILGGPFGETPLCTEDKPQVSVLVTAWTIVPPGGGLGPAGGIQAAKVANEVRYPPAPNEFMCGRWKPRLANAVGEAVR